MAGRVVRRAGGDTLAAGSARVILHRVSREASGKLDSVVANGGGEFRFRFPPDTGQVYLLSTRWSGIEYFSDPLPGSSLRATTVLTLLVADTTSNGKAETAGRFLVLGSSGASRDRRVVDLYVLRNPGDRTIVVGPGDEPTWRAPLPPGAVQSRVGSVGSEISAEAVRFERDSVMVFAPIAPGEKQLLVEYLIPSSVARLEVDPATRDSVQVVAEEQGVRVDGLAQAPDQVLDGRTFARWAGRAGAPIIVTFPVEASGDRALLPLLVVAGLVMFAAVAVALRKRPRASRPSTPTADALVNRIAALDSAHAGRDLSNAERERYQGERAALKRALTDALRRNAPRDAL